MGNEIKTPSKSRDEAIAEFDSVLCNLRRWDSGLGYNPLTKEHFDSLKQAAQNLWHSRDSEIEAAREGLFDEEQVKNIFSYLLARFSDDSWATIMRYTENNPDWIKKSSKVIKSTDYAYQKGDWKKKLIEQGRQSAQNTIKELSDTVDSLTKQLANAKDMQNKAAQKLITRTEQNTASAIEEMELYDTEQSHDFNRGVGFAKAEILLRLKKKHLEAIK